MITVTARAIQDHCFEVERGAVMLNFPVSIRTSNCQQHPSGHHLVNSEGKAISDEGNADESRNAPNGYGTLVCITVTRVPFELLEG